MLNLYSMNRTVLLNSINSLINYNNFDRERLNQLVAKEHGVAEYNQLPTEEMELLHGFLIKVAKKTQKSQD